MPFKLTRSTIFLLLIGILVVLYLINNFKEGHENMGCPAPESNAVVDLIIPEYSVDKTLYELDNGLYLDNKNGNLLEVHSEIVTDPDTGDSGAGDSGAGDSGAGFSSACANADDLALLMSIGDGEPTSEQMSSFSTKCMMAMMNMNADTGVNDGVVDSGTGDSGAVSGVVDSGAVSGVVDTGAVSGVVDTGAVSGIDPIAGPVIDPIAGPIVDPVTGNSDEGYSNMEKVTKIILNPRVSDTTFTYIDFAEGENVDKATLTLEDSFKSFRYEADGTTLFYMPWNKDTYIHMVKDNTHSKLFYATSENVESNTINKEGYQSDSTYSDENNNKVVEYALYNNKNAYQITKKMHFDITNGNFLHCIDDKLTIYNRAGSVVETDEATTVEEKGFHPFVVKDKANSLDVLYIPNGINTMIVILGKYLGENTLLNVVRFTPEGVVNVKSGQAACVNENLDVKKVETTEENEIDDKYILKTQIVPPVCPTCPSCPSCCNSDKKETCGSCGGNGGCGTKDDKGDSLLKDANDIRDDLSDAKKADAKKSETTKTETTKTEPKKTNVGGVINNTVDAAGNIITGTVDTASDLIEKTGAGIYDILTQNRNNGNSSTNTGMNTGMNTGTNTGTNTRNTDYKMNTGNTGNTGNAMTYNDYSRNGLLPPSNNSKYMARTADFSAFSK